MKNLLYAGLFSIVLSGCAPIKPIPPAHPFKINGYSVFVDHQPGSYDIMPNIIPPIRGEEKCCYFYKRLENNDELFITDVDCDLDSDRVFVLSRNKIVAASHIGYLEKEVVGMLNYILQNHKKTIIK